MSETDIRDLSAFSLFDLFRTEVENQAAILSAGLLALEERTATGAPVEPLMRAAHSIKGAARIVGLDAGVQVAHALEDCFVAAQSGGLTLRAEHMDVLLRGVDLLTRLARTPEAELPAWPETHAAELAQMLSALAAVVAPPPPAAPAAPAPSGLPSGPAPVPAPSEPAPPPPEAAAPSEAEAPGGEAERTVRVDASSMSRLLGLAGESLVQTRWFEPFAQSLLQLRKGQQNLGALFERLAEALEKGDAERARGLLDDAAAQACHCGALLAERMAEFDDAQRRTAGIAEQVYREVLSSRMRPFADGARGFPRMVRDLARRLHRQVHFEMHGRDTPVDRDILEKLEAPLTHLLRNAVDHGLETPDERQAAGKPPRGSLVLAAAHRAGMLVLTVSDDGRGVDPEALRRKIVARGLVSAEVVGQMSEAELLEFLFLPGFTTREEVTELSGRGVGLDVVAHMVQEVQGSVQIESRARQGATFRLQLPLTRSVLRALVVGISGEPYAFPLHRVMRCARVPAASVQQVGNRECIALDGRNIGLAPAHQVLELPEPAWQDEELSVVVLSDQADACALQVDRFIGERDLVLRPLDARLGKVADVSAASLLDDGTPVLLLDVDDMLRSAATLLATGRLRKVSLPGGALGPRAPKRVLVVDDSITVREVERRLLEGRGYEVDIAVNGVDGWNALRGRRYDLLVSDVDMPRMSGLELVRRVRQDQALHALPVLFVSYKDSPEDRVRGLEAGASGYLAKTSFHDDTLLAAVAGLIGEARP